MGINSIRKNLNKDTIISEIKLSLGADIEKKRICLVVEGRDDIKFLRKFCGDNIIIYESFSGKRGVEEIIASTVIDDYRVIGIRDRDYSNCKRSNRIFFYDKCCLEMMILSFDETFQSICCEFYDGELSSIQLKMLIFDQLYKVSRLREYNEKKSLGINFNGLAYSAMIDDKYKLDKAIFLKELLKKNPHKDESLLWIFEEIEKSKKREQVDCLELTNGHDFVAYFKILCDKERSSGNASDREIASSLRASFNKDFFILTDLYQSIDRYCTNYNLNSWEC